MLPKDILVHLEKGDRTDEFLENRIPEGSLQDTLNALNAFVSEQMAREQWAQAARAQNIDQIQRQAMQQNQGLGMASAGLMGNLWIGGGPLR